MNLTYWLVVCVLLAIAFFIIIPPLWKKREIKQAGSDQRNIRIARERADDLKQQLESASLTQAQFDEQYAELELTLGDDLDIAQNLHLATSVWPQAFRKLTIYRSLIAGPSGVDQA